MICPEVRAGDPCAGDLSQARERERALFVYNN